jgi:ribonuclease HI
MNYKLYTDGGARGNPGPSGIGAILFDDQDKLIWFENKFINNATNNQAEYLALILGLKLCIKYQVGKVNCYLDSELIVKQLNGEYKVKDAKMKKLKTKVDELISEFSQINFCHVTRDKNKFADKLVNLSLDNALNNQ